MIEPAKLDVVVRRATAKGLEADEVPRVLDSAICARAGAAEAEDDCAATECGNTVPPSGCTPSVV